MRPEKAAIEAIGGGTFGERGVRAVLVDIEGTTTAIAFVKDTLFPFAEAALDGFLAAHGKQPQVAAILAKVQALAPEVPPADTLRGWSKADAKMAPLKALQGLIWQAGYLDGRLKGHLWPDVAASLGAWAAGGLTLAVYSSGSVAAQRLLFCHSEAGDMTPLFSGYFDTRVGAKADAASYAAISQEMGVAAANILFLSDVTEELDAAAAAGLATCQLVRPGDGTIRGPRHPHAVDFPAVSARFGLPAG